MKRTLIAAGLALAILVGGGAAGTTAVLAKTGGGGCHLPKTDAAGVTVDLKQNCFLPTVLRIEPGAEVRFESFDKQFHTVTSVAQSQPGGWGTYDELMHGDVVTHVFDEPGVYPYFCVLHPGMVGAIVVGDGTSSAAASAPANTLRASAAPAPRLSDDGANATTVVAASAGGAAIALVAACAVAGLVVARRHKHA